MSAEPFFSVPVRLRETQGWSRDPAHVRIGLPLSRGAVRDPAILGATGPDGLCLPFQGRVLARWPDRTAKWLLADVLCAAAPHSTTTFLVGANSANASLPAAQAPVLHLRHRPDTIEVDTGAARFAVPRRGAALVSSVERQGRQLLDASGILCRLTDLQGRHYAAVIGESTIEEQGPVAATLKLSGRFRGPGGVPPVEFVARIFFCAGVATLRLEVGIWNPRAALHPGGLWDLGDPASFQFRDLSIACGMPESGVLRWSAEPGHEQRQCSAAAWTLYQDSSGGECWNSPNHVDRHGSVTVTFPGYRVLEESAGNAVEIARGSRATPQVLLHGGHGWMAVGVRDFWQSFPKALRRRGASLEAGLFPRESAAGFELQGGEQKRHEVQLEFGLAGESSGLHLMQRPVEASVDPAWIESTAAIPWFTAAGNDDEPRYSAYVQQIVEGERSFFLRRELIDEYGWRNFGDLYADHEAVNHSGPEPFVSHYNNQYDFVHGAFLHHLRSGDARWRSLLEDAARHAIDIDIYRTQGDRPAFNGGLFWHTDHYRPAATCTHRTYSRANAGGGAYGGGPANEHDYSSGLLHFHYLTGDPEAAQTVRVLADWVVAMDDGARTPLAWIDSGPTGFASCTVEPDFHKPGRGAGNSINTLLDAFALTEERPYLAKAEELIRRCIHPLDDVAALRLDEPEHRWSYLVFLQVLGKYLLAKRELGELDAAFHYARDSLLHYARWMVVHEVPYADVLHKVELPTETWPAHDIRKCHVLHLAAEYSAGEQRERLAARAEHFHHRCLEDLLGFPTAWLTRPLVILAVYGTIHTWFRRHGYAPAAWSEPHGHDFGLPAKFVGQKQRVAARFAGRALVLAVALPRLVRERWALLCHRFSLTRAG